MDLNNCYAHQLRKDDYYWRFHVSPTYNVLRHEEENGLKQPHGIANRFWLPVPRFLAITLGWAKNSEKSKRTGSTAANTPRLWGWVARLFTFAAFCRVMKGSTYKLFASHYLVQRYVYVRIVPSLRKLPSLLAPLFADETSIAARSEERWLFSQVSYFFVGDKSRMMLETDWSWGLQISFWWSESSDWHYVIKFSQILHSLEFTQHVSV